MADDSIKDEIPKRRKKIAIKYIVTGIVVVAALVSMFSNIYNLDNPSITGNQLNDSNDDLVGNENQQNNANIQITGSPNTTVTVTQDGSENNNASKIIPESSNKSILPTSNWNLKPTGMIFDNYNFAISFPEKGNWKLVTNIDFDFEYDTNIIDHKIDELIITNTNNLADPGNSLRITIFEPNDLTINENLGKIDKMFNEQNIHRFNPLYDVDGRIGTTYTSDILCQVIEPPEPNCQKSWLMILQKHEQTLYVFQAVSFADAGEPLPQFINPNIEFIIHSFRIL